MVYMASTFKGTKPFKINKSIANGRQQTPIGIGECVAFYFLSSLTPSPLFTLASYLSLSTNIKEYDDGQLQYQRQDQLSISDIATVQFNFNI